MATRVSDTTSTLDDLHRSETISSKVKVESKSSKKALSKREIVLQLEMAEKETSVLNHSNSMG